MKHLSTVAILFACTLVFNSCKKQEESNDPIPTENGSRGTLQLGGCLQFKAPFFWKVCLTDISDSVCPCNSQCIWAGELIYTLHATGPGVDSVFSLQPQGNWRNAPSSIELGDFKLDIDHLSPACPEHWNRENYKMQVTLTY